MARLDAPAAATTTADLDLVASDHARPWWRRQILLVLAGDPLDLEQVAAVRARSGQLHGDHPVDTLGDRPPRMPPVRRTWLVARPPGVAGRGVLRERRRLALGRPPQLLHPGGQLTDPGGEPLVLAGQPLDLPSELVTLGPHYLALGLHHRDLLAQPAHRLAPPTSPSTPHRCHRGANHTP
jgi:hypothetical protein